MKLFKDTASAEPKNSTTRKKSRLGGYSIALIFIVLAVLVAVNLIVAELPTKYTHVDVSELQIYSLSDESTEYLDTLDRDVTLYLVTTKGTEGNDIYEILTKYAAESSHISVVLKDPSLYPNFVSQYSATPLTDNSVIVESGDKSKAIDYSSIFALDYTTYYSTGRQVYNYNGEALITGAIDYVTREDLPILYTVSGHGEPALSSKMSASLSSKNYTVNDLPLLSADEIPADCDILLMNSPAQDISEAEAELLLNYLEKGGKLLLFTAPSATELPNLMKVTESYGVRAQNGVLCDSDPEHHYQNYLMLLVDKRTHEITSDQIADGTYTLIPLAHGISVLDQYRSSVTVKTLLSTSNDAYLKADPQAVDTLEKQDGDVEGTFNIAVAVEEVYDNTTSRIVWFASSMENVEYYDTAVGGANSKLILSSLDWLNGGESLGVNVPSKALTSDASMVIPAGQRLLWIAVMLLIIPVGFVIYGLVYWLKRRKR